MRTQPNEEEAYSKPDFLLRSINLHTNPMKSIYYMCESGPFAILVPTELILVLKKKIGLWTTVCVVFAVDISSEYQVFWLLFPSEN